MQATKACGEALNRVVLVKLFRTLNGLDFNMGITICKKHGRTGIIIDVLREVCQKISNDIPLNQHDLSTVIVDYFDENELLLTAKYIITIQFKKEFSLRDYYKISDEKDGELFFKLVESKMGAICGMCYQEYMAKHNIKINFK